MKIVEIPGGIDQNDLKEILKDNLGLVFQEIHHDKVIATRDVTTDEFEMIKVAFKLCQVKLRETIR